MNFYQLLNVDGTASSDEIKKNYRRLAMKYHPDRNHSDPASAEANFKKIKEAYETLIDPKKRQNYDQSIQLKVNIHFDFDVDMYQKQYSEIFQNNYQSAKPQKNSSITLNASLSLEEILFGKNLVGNVTLPSGKEQTIDLIIPAGLSTGDVIKYAELGDDTISAIPRGDLFIKIVERPHLLFKRHGNDLIFDLTVSVFDAILGTNVNIPTLDGKTLKLKIPPGTLPDTVFNCPTYGLPSKNNTSKRGNLYIKTHFCMPTDLSDNEKQMLEQIRLSHK